MIALQGKVRKNQKKIYKNLRTLCRAIALCEPIWRTNLNVCMLCAELYRQIKFTIYSTKKRWAKSMATKSNAS
jgi:hypothetical protein